MSTLHHDRSRAESFGAAAERYDRSRPTYPPALVDAVVGAGGPGLDVLDVGCGTGIASRLFATRGTRVLGVEVDARMAEVARAGGIEVEVSGFEEWDPRGRTFDRVTAGQAWHWVNPVVGAAKAAGVLRPGGKLMPFWNVATPPADVKAALDEVYRDLAPGADSASVQSSSGRHAVHEAEYDGIRSCSELTDPEIDYFPWVRVYTRGEWLDQLPTHSDHARLEPDVLARLLDRVGAVIDRFGGSFEMSYRTQLIRATRL